MIQNPNFYNLTGRSGEHVNDHLSELVESTLEELAKTKCINVEDETISPANLGIIASYYSIKCGTISSFDENMSATRTLS